MAAKKRVWVVVCQSWSYNDEWYDGDDTPIKGFAVKEEAEAYRKRCTKARGHDDGETHFVVVPMDWPAE